MSDSDFIHLLANPYHIRKHKVIKNDRGNEIFSLLRKKYPEYYINEKYQKDILNKIETLLFTKTLESTVNDIIDTIECNSLNNPLNMM